MDHNHARVGTSSCAQRAHCFFEYLRKQSPRGLGYGMVSRDFLFSSYVQTVLRTRMRSVNHFACTWTSAYADKTAKCFLYSFIPAFSVSFVFKLLGCVDDDDVTNYNAKCKSFCNSYGIYTTYKRAKVCVMFFGVHVISKRVRVCM